MQTNNRYLNNNKNRNAFRAAVKESYSSFMSKKNSLKKDAPQMRSSALGFTELSPMKNTDRVGNQSMATNEQVLALKHHMSLNPIKFNTTVNSGRNMSQGHY